MKAIRQHIQQLGVTLLELMLSLAIIAVLLILATRYYEGARLSQQVNQAGNDIQAIVAAMANKTAGNPNYSATTNCMKDLMATGYLPSVWGSTASTANPWGGSYTCAVNSGSAGQGQVQIAAAGLPSTACTNLENMFTGINQNSSPCDEGANNSATFTGLFGTGTGSVPDDN